MDFRPCCFSAGRVLLLTVTEACNQGCSHCMREAVIGKAAPLDLVVLGPAVRRAVADFALERVVISGGEPTLVPNLAGLIRAVAEAHARPSLCTNATRMHRLAYSYADAGLRSVTVSLDGIGKEHDRWRGAGGSFGRALRGIDACVNAALSVTVNVTLHDGVIDAAEPLAGILQDRGIASVSVTSPMWSGRMARQDGKARRVSRHTSVHFARQLQTLLDCPVSLRIPQCDRVTCPSHRTVFAMNTRGVLTGCPDVGATNAVDRNP